jgi:hypothetical protein
MSFPACRNPRENDEVLSYERPKNSIDQSIRTSVGYRPASRPRGPVWGDNRPGITPTELRALFEEFEEIANGQMFVFLDDIQERIGAFSIKAVFDEAPAVGVRDLQVFPSRGEVSLRLVGVPSRVV